MKIQLGLIALAFAVQAQPQTGHLTPRPGHPNAPLSGTIEFRSFPRIMLGNQWQTSLVLVNPGATPAQFQQSFFDASGNAVTISVHSDSPAIDVTAAAIQGVLTAGSSLMLDLAAPGGSGPLQAWSLLSFTGGDIEGYATLGLQAPSGTFSFQTTLPLSHTQDVSTYMPFDNRQDFRSQVTLVNPASDTSAHVRLTYLNPQGGIVLIDVVTLAPRQQTTLVLPDTYPDLANKNGTVFIEADTDRLSVAGLRQNVDYGVISALPAANSVSTQP